MCACVCVRCEVCVVYGGCVCACMCVCVRCEVCVCCMWGLRVCMRDWAGGLCGDLVVVGCAKPVSVIAPSTLWWGVYAWLYPPPPHPSTHMHTHRQTDRQRQGRDRHMHAHTHTHTHTHTRTMQRYAKVWCDLQDLADTHLVSSLPTHTLTPPPPPHCCHRYGISCVSWQTSLRGSRRCVSSTATTCGAKGASPWCQSGGWGGGGVGGV